MNKLWRRQIITPFYAYQRNLNHEILRRTIPICNYTSLGDKLMPLINLNISHFNIDFIRRKSYKKRENDLDDDMEDSSLSKDSKVVKFNTTSMRTDMILKSTLGVARNKIEQMFYESKIRVNGKKVMKKSASVRLGDEVDMIKSVSPKNPNHLYISRVEIVDVTANEDSISVTARRFKNLLIENYENDPYKGSTSE